MSDSRLRELERRWKETGAPDDEAAYLLERVRVGDLTRERLELAAYCGHEGARRAVGECEDLGRVLSRPLEDVLLAGGIACAAFWLGDLVLEESTRAESQRSPCAPLLRAALEWCRCPCGWHAEAAEATAREVHLWAPSPDETDDDSLDRLDAERRWTSIAFDGVEVATRPRARRMSLGRLRETFGSRSSDPSRLRRVAIVALASPGAASLPNTDDDERAPVGG